MREQVYFEDIAVDAALPMLAKEPVTLQDLVAVAAKILKAHAPR